MHVFVTGASGWIGSAVIPELLDAGHRVTGLARSQASADALTAAGVTPLAGSLDDLDSLRAGAAASDGVIHLGFKHDFSDMAGAGRTERAAVAALGDTLAGSDRPLLFAAGVAGLTPGRAVTENDASPAVGPDAPRGGGENFAFEYASRGVRPVALRFAPTVHGEGDHGFISTIAGVARDRGVSGYVGDGANRWAAVNRADAARLVRLALEQAEAGAIVHAVGEEGISTREIAAAIGDALSVPTESVAPDAAADHFGWIGMFFGFDMSASSALTQERYGWTPTHPGLREDLAAGYYTRGA
ncbi:3-beta hydroxysteroid dehydrogenase [Subtercola boreus]|uniref:3-beta hydroxysteroid dehydrogenase n=1 Tax=Subtercola boreus TaxID=120213 RepID=A0A3E0VP54_9MICO|nr:SDR family oxidoreductase [Subtercola boreus]RFA11389.1 3-beta hydroxysteroid dehydrogenase [Subtercola boreus]TQL55449.1 nucleoside-diphosphate-sugar epimerase [Subtercola boreus]